MKKYLRAISIFLLIAMLGVLFASCNDEKEDKGDKGDKGEPTDFGKGTDYKDTLLDSYLIKVPSGAVSFDFESNGDGTCTLTACSIKEGSGVIESLDLPAVSPSGERVVCVNIVGASKGGNVPRVMTEEKFKALDTALGNKENGTSTFEMMKFRSHYSLLNIEEMVAAVEGEAEKEEMRSSLLEKYPFAEIMSLYVLSDNTGKNDIKALSEIFTKLKYTQADCINDYNKIMETAIDNPEANDAILRSVPKPYISVSGNVKSVNVPEGVKVVGSIGFEGIVGVNLPQSLVEIGSNAFWGSLFERIDIPSGVTKISRNAFRFCNALESITIPKSVDTIENNAFSGCDNLTDIKYEGTTAEWNALVENQNFESWELGPKGYIVTCSDGTVEHHEPVPIDE